MNTLIDKTRIFLNQLNDIVSTVQNVLVIDDCESEQGKHLLVELIYKCEDYIKTRNEIRDMLIKSPVIAVPEYEDDDIREAIRKISSGELLQIEIEYKPILQDYLEIEDYDFLIDNPIDIIDDNLDIYIDYLLTGIKSIITRSESIPKELSIYFQELRKSYIFKFYLASTALCRTIIEITLRHICKLEGLFDPDSSNYKITRGYYERKARVEKREYRIIEDYMMQPNDLRHILCQISDFKKHKENIQNLYSELSRVVHGSTVIDKEEAKEYMDRTIDLIHELYDT